MAKTVVLNDQGQEWGVVSMAIIEITLYGSPPSYDDGIVWEQGEYLGHPCNVYTFTHPLLQNQTFNKYGVVLGFAKRPCEDPSVGANYGHYRSWDPFPYLMLFDEWEFYDPEYRKGMYYEKFFFSWHVSHVEGTPYDNISITLYAFSNDEVYLDPSVYDTFRFVLLHHNTQLPSPIITPASAKIVGGSIITEELI